MKSIKKNFFYQFVYQLVNILLPLITTPYVSRKLGAEQLGVFAYANTVAYYFWVVAMLGFETHGERRIAAVQDDKNKRSEVFSEIVLLQFIFTSICFVVYSAYTCTLTGVKLSLAWIHMMYVASSFINIIWVFEGIEDFKKITVRNILIKIISAILIILLIRDRNDLVIYTAIIAGNGLLGNLVFVVGAQRYVSFVKVSFDGVKRHIIPLIKVFLPQIGITVFMHMDKLMLGWWSSSRELGYYQNSERIVGVPTTLILSVGIVMMPRISRLRAEKKYDQIKKYNELTMELLMVIGAACSFGLVGIADDFCPWFFGADFNNCGIILALLSLQILFMVIENLFQKQYLTPFEKDNIVTFCMIGAALINVLLNVILIPRKGAIGAIIGSLISHLFICVAEGVVLRRNLPIKLYLRVMFRCILIGAVMCIIVKGISLLMSQCNSFISIIVMIVVGGVVYAVFTLIFISINKTELYEYLVLSKKKILVDRLKRE